MLIIFYSAIAALWLTGIIHSWEYLGRTTNPPAIAVFLYLFLVLSGVGYLGWGFSQLFLMLFGAK